MTPESTKSSLCEKASSRILGAIQHVFYKIGVSVAAHPWNTIIVCGLLTTCCGVGLLKFNNEKDPMQLWVPRDSKFFSDTKWIIDHIQYGYRIQSVIVTAPNVLDPNVLMKVARIHNEVKNLSARIDEGNRTIGWEDVCLKVPFIPPDINFAALDVDAQNLIQRFMKNPDVCKIVNELPHGCLEQNLLELWSFNNDTISQLTTSEIAEKVTSTKTSPFSGHLMEFSELLGGVVRDSDEIQSAEALISHWFVALNFSEVNLKETGNMAGTEDWVTLEDLAFEELFLNRMELLKREIEDNETKVYFSTARSFGDISSKTMMQEIDKIVIGVIIMFIFIEIVLSKFSCLDFRFGLGGCGLLSVGLAFFSSIGICSVIGVPYGPVHASLPFLLMGLGVDDVFVMMACWRSIKNTQDPIQHRMGLMLKHAGASITVTSLTDMIAFLIGALTVIPSLRSFCIYAAIGVGMTYFFALTFFVACFTFDEYRIRANRNAFLPCLAHKGNVSNLWCDMNIMQRCLNYIYSKFILTKPGKIIVILTVIGLTGLSIESVLHLEQKFDQNWFIPSDTYLHQYLEKNKQYFPESGFEASIYIAPKDFPQSLPLIYDVVKELEQKDKIIDKIDAWIVPFFEFVELRYSKDLRNETITDNEWNIYLSMFLFSHSGGRFQAYFRFNSTLICGSPAPRVTVSWINFRFKTFYSRNDYIPAMHYVSDLVARQNFTKDGGFSSVWSKAFANWMTDEIIDIEVYRNLGLALVCVMACTIVMIFNIQICFWIFICVLLTLINVGGFMQKWGLTIDLVSCIGLQLAVGLCVDYAAHIGHTFIVTTKGNRNERVLATISKIGAAVIYGGTSTLVALLMLSGSQAYTFKSFFKIFFLVIVFGLFHGVVFLPVILSFIGPKPIRTSRQDERELEIEKVSEGEELQAMNTKANSVHLDQNGDLDEIQRLNS